MKNIINNRIKGVIFASITALFWGFLAIALKVASGILDPLTIVWFRFLTAFFILFTIFLIKKPQYLKILYKPPLLLIIASLGLGINYIAFLLGLKLTSPGTAQILIQIGPILLGLVGLIFFKEKISLRQGIGFLIAGTGMILFYKESVAHFLSEEEMFNMGVLWIVVAAMAWVVYATFQKTLVNTYHSQQLNLFLFGLPVILFLPFIKPSELLYLSTGNWLLLIYLGLNTLIAYGSLALAFKYLEANKVSIIITMNPIITFITLALLAYYEINWIQPEALTFNRIIAAIVVLTGAIMAVTFTKKEKKIDLSKYFSEDENVK